MQCDGSPHLGFNVSKPSKFEQYRPYFRRFLLQTISVSLGSVALKIAENKAVPPWSGVWRSNLAVLNTRVCLKIGYPKCDGCS